MKLSLRALVFSLICLTACTHHYYVQEHSERLYSVKDEQADSAMLSMLAPYKQGVDTQMQVVIGNTDIPLTKAQPECTLGNLIVDALMDRAHEFDNHVEAAVLNYGMMRIPYLPPGLITNGRIYELLPFDDVITIVDVPGDVMQQFCDHMARYKGWPINNIRYIVRDKRATDVMIGNKPLNQQLVYRVAVGSYIAKGGDNCDFLEPLKKTYTNILVRDAVFDYIGRMKSEKRSIHPKLEKRVSYAE